MNAQTAAADAAPGPRPRLGLSGKLLVLTVLFVMIAEVLIYVPSIANFRLNWLRDRLAAAHTAALVLDAAPSGMVPESLTRQILDSVGAKAVAMKKGEQRRLLAISEIPSVLHQDVDVRNVSGYRAIVEAFQSMLGCEDTDLIRAVGPAPMGGEFVEIVVPMGPLRHAMVRFSINILLLSLIISAVTAFLVYVTLLYLFVRPMRRITTNMTSFREDPENPARIISPSARQDEIASMLNQKSHLAALGLAVSKINHDLRNLLSSAQLVSDQLSGLPDPRVQRFAPKLMRALERAIAFCQSTLSYGRAQEPPPDRRAIPLESLVEEVRETVNVSPNGPIRWIGAVERGLMIDADADQLFRVLVNLARNSVQVLEMRAPNDRARDQIRIAGRREGAVVVIEVSDTGPSIPEKARVHLFEAFQGSTRTGGTGLGLAIAAELVRAHGGEIHLVEGTIGATFRISIPDRAIEIGSRRGARGRG